MVSFRSSPSLGLEVSDTALRVVLAGKQRGRVLIETCGEADLPVGVIERGMVRDPHTCGQAIRSLLQSLQPPLRTKRAVLCLPPQHVFTSILELPSLEGTSSTEVPEEELAKIIPEEISNLTVVSHALSRGKEGVVIGVAAVRNDVLRGYLDALQEVPLEVMGVTTLPAVLAPLTRASHECSSFVLVLQGKGIPQAVTCFLKLWPIDEAVLGDNGEFLSELQELVRDNRGKHDAPERVVVYAEGEKLRKDIRDLCSGSLGISMEAFPEIGGMERRWVGTAAASLAGQGRLTLNFLQEERSPRHVLFVISTFAAAIAIGVLWYFI